MITHQKCTVLKPTSLSHMRLNHDCCCCWAPSVLCHRRPLPWLKFWRKFWRKACRAGAPPKVVVACRKRGREARKTVVEDMVFVGMLRLRVCDISYLSEREKKGKIKESVAIGAEREGANQL